MQVLRRLDRWAPPFVLMAVIFLLSAQPDLDSGLGTVDTIGRKLLHAGEYALLTFLWWRALRETMPDRKAAVASFLLAVAYAATDEYHQGFVAGRNGSPLDWAIDSAGAGVALAGLRRRRAARV